MSLRYTCNKVRKKVQNEEKKKISEKGIWQIRDLGLIGGRERDTGAEGPAG